MGFSYCLIFSDRQTCHFLSINPSFPICNPDMRCLQTFHDTHTHSFGFPSLLNTLVSLWSHICQTLLPQSTLPPFRKDLFLLILIMCRCVCVCAHTESTLKGQMRCWIPWSWNCESKVGTRSPAPGFCKRTAHSSLRAISPAPASFHVVS